MDKLIFSFVNGGQNSIRLDMSYTLYTQMAVCAESDLNYYLFALQTACTVCGYFMPNPNLPYKVVFDIPVVSAMLLVYLFFFHIFCRSKSGNDGTYSTE